MNSPTSFQPVIVQHRKNPLWLVVPLSRGRTVDRVWQGMGDESISRPWLEDCDSFPDLGGPESRDLGMNPSSGFIHLASPLSP